MVLVVVFAKVSVVNSVVAAVCVDHGAGVNFASSVVCVRKVDAMQRRGSAFVLLAIEDFFVKVLALQGSMVQNVASGEYLLLEVLTFHFFNVMFSQ